MILGTKSAVSAEDIAIRLREASASRPTDSVPLNAEAM